MGKCGGGLLVTPDNDTAKSLLHWPPDTLIAETELEPNGGGAGGPQSLAPQENQA